MNLLKQSAAVTIRLGPYLDKTTGVDEETGITPVVEVSKNHAAFAARNSATAITHDSNGWFAVELDATDTGTLGPMTVKSDDAATFLPVWREFLVVPANVYDSLVGGSDKLQVDLQEWIGVAPLALVSQRAVSDVGAISGDSVAADNLEAAFDGGAYNVGGGSIVAASVTGAVGSVTGAVGSVTGAVGSVTGAVGSVTGGVTLAASAVQAIWDALTSALTTVGSIGKLLVDNINATIGSRATPAQVNTEADAAIADAALATAAALATVQADTDNLQTRIPAALVGGRMDASAGAMAAGVITGTAIAVSGAQKFWDSDKNNVSTVDSMQTLITTNLDGTVSSRASQASVDAVQADLPTRITKNVALSNFPFLMVDSTDHTTGKTGLTVTAQRRIDNGSFAACANAPTEVANGVYTIDLAAADLNGTTICLKMTAAGADARFITIVTQP